MGRTTQVVVRTAGAADAEDLARVRIASWRAAYRGIVPDAVLDGFDPVAEVVTWRQRVAAVTDVWTGVALVAEPPARPRLVGFVTTGAARHAGEAGLGEVWAIYVDPDAQGRGVGRALMDAAIRDLEARGLGEAVLWVFEANAPARAFYERLGWTPDGAAKPLVIGGAAPVELRYRRRLP
jgi:ribosomal protein S18 acetylase RimI-like enzyme